MATPRKRFQLEGVLKPGEIARLTSFLSKGEASPMEQSPAAMDAVLFSREKVTTLSRAVESARLSLAFSSLSSTLQAPEDGAKRESFCWEVVQACAKGRSASLGLGSGLRNMLTDLLRETMSADGKTAVALDPSKASFLNALTDAELVRVLVFLRPDLVPELKIRLEAKGIEYPEDPYALSRDYSLLIQRDLTQIPEVKKLIEDPSFELRTQRSSGFSNLNPERTQHLVFEALRLYPTTMPWMTQALETIGRKSVSAFAQGGLEPLGSSVLFTAIKSNPLVWAQIAPAVAHARESYVDYGSRSDANFKREAQIPWALLGRLYHDALPSLAEPKDCFHAFGAYRRIFSDNDPIRPEEFYRNVGILFLRMQEPNFKFGKSLFHELCQPGFEKDFVLTDFHRALMDVFRDRAQRGFVQLPDAQRSALPAFFSARKDESQPVALGRMLSTEPFATAFFEEGHPLYFGDVVNPVARQYFLPTPELVNLDGAIAFTEKDREEIDRLCNVMQLFKDQQFSFPYTVTERLYGFGHSSKHLSPVSADVIEVLRALPARGVEPFSPISLSMQMLRPYLDRPEGFQGLAMDPVQVARSVICFAANAGATPGDALRDQQLQTLFERLYTANSLQELFSMVDAHREILPPIGRKEFNNVALDMGFQPVAETEIPFGYTATEHRDLQRLLTYPVGLYFLDRRMEPDPFTIIRAGAYFEQIGEPADAFWGYHLEALRSRVEQAPTPVLQPGVKFHRDARLITAELLDKGCLEAYSFVLNQPRDQTPALTPEAISLENMSGGRVAWDSAKSWEAATTGLALMEKQVKQALGHSVGLDGVAPFLRLTAAFYPQHADFFLSGAELASTMLKCEPYHTVSLPAEVTLHRIREKLGRLDVQSSEPVFGLRSLVQPTI